MDPFLRDIAGSLALLNFATVFVITYISALSLKPTSVRIISAAIVSAFVTTILAVVMVGLYYFPDLILPVMLILLAIMGFAFIKREQDV